MPVDHVDDASSILVESYWTESNNMYDSLLIVATVDVGVVAAATVVVVASFFS